MYTYRTTTTTEVRELVRMLQYYRDIWPWRSHVLSPMTEAAIGPNGREVFWNNDMEVAFCDIKRMVSADTLLNYLYWKITFTVKTDSPDKQLGAVISKNDKPIASISIKPSKPHRNYTTTGK